MRRAPEPVRITSPGLHPYRLSQGESTAQNITSTPR